jgi:hypothetical protein
MELTFETQSRVIQQVSINCHQVFPFVFNSLQFHFRWNMLLSGFTITSIRLMFCDGLVYHFISVVCTIQHIWTRVNILSRNSILIKLFKQRALNAARHHFRTFYGFSEGWKGSIVEGYSIMCDCRGVECCKLYWKNKNCRTLCSEHAQKWIKSKHLRFKNKFRNAVTHILL